MISVSSTGMWVLWKPDTIVERACVGKRADSLDQMQRYHRQILLPQIGTAGQQRLLESRVQLIGCGALGSVIAEQLARAGVGFLRIVDRDIVELTNLQRQVLFDEADVAEEMPKAVAAARRLRAINSTVQIESVVADVNVENIETLARIAPSPGTPGEGWGGGS